LDVAFRLDFGNLPAGAPRPCTSIARGEAPEALQCGAVENASASRDPGFGSSPAGAPPLSPLLSPLLLPRLPLSHCRCRLVPARGAGSADSRRSRSLTPTHTRALQLAHSCTAKTFILSDQLHSLAHTHTFSLSFSHTLPLTARPHTLTPSCSHSLPRSQPSHKNAESPGNARAH